MSEEHVAPQTEKEQLLAALRIKADAFANRDWETYWTAEGPGLLTSGWIATHPDILLAKVEEVCSLDFLSSAVKSLSLESHQDHDTSIAGENYHTESILAVSGGNGVKTGAADQLESSLDLEMEVSSSHEGAETVAESIGSEEQGATVSVVGHPVEGQEVTVDWESKENSSMGMTMALSSEEIIAMWNEHYNSYYWYTYQMFVEGQTQQLPPGEGGENGNQEWEAMEPNGGEVRTGIV